MADQTNIWLWDASTAAWIKDKADPAGRLEVVPGHEDLVQVRATATGLIYTGAAYLHWLGYNPSGPNSA